MGSALSNTCCFSRVSTTMRADPHLRYRRHSNDKETDEFVPSRLCKIQVLTPSDARAPQMTHPRVSFLPPELAAAPFPTHPTPASRMFYGSPADVSLCHEAVMRMPRRSSSVAFEQSRIVSATFR